MGWEFLTEANFVNLWFPLATALSELDANTKAHIAAASTQPPARAGLCCPNVFWIQYTKHSPWLLRASLTCTGTRDKSFAYKTDVHTAFLDAISWRKPGIFYSWDIAQKRRLILTITSDSLNWYLVNPVSALGYSQFSLHVGCSFYLEMLLFGLSFTWGKWKFSNNLNDPESIAIELWNVTIGFSLHDNSQAQRSLCAQTFI